MPQQARPPRENRTISVDFHNEATYFQLLGDGKAFVECVLAFLLALGLQLKHKATCRGGGCLTRHSHYIRVRLGGLTIWRVQCTTCKAVFTVLPHFVLRYRQCGLPLPVYFLADEKHSRCLTDKVYLPTIVRGLVLWPLGYTKDANATACRQSYQEFQCVALQQEPSYRVRGILTDGFDGYPFNAGHCIASITDREGLMALPRPGQVLDLR
jgi:hypothetical protein